MWLSPNQYKIVQLLSDEVWHCPTKELFVKDDRKRISELSRMRREDGTKIYNIEGVPCTLHKHDSRVYMRRLIKPKQKSRVEYNPLTGVAKEVVS